MPLGGGILDHRSSTTARWPEPPVVWRANEALSPVPYRVPATPSAAPLSAAAQSEESFGFLPFVARIAFPAACLRAFLAFLSSFVAFFAGLVAAWSMRFSAVLSLPVTLAGMA